MLRKTFISFGLVFLLLMQIAALAADPLFEVESTKSELSPHDHHHHSPLSISLDNFDGKSFNLELFSIFDAEVLMEIESNVLFQSGISDGDDFNIFANVPVDFSVSLHDYEDQFEVILVLTATTIEGYYFREQLTLTNEAMYEPRCKYEFSMAEAIENDCASPSVSEIDISAGDSGTLNSWGLNFYGTTNSQYVTGTFQYEDREFDETGFIGVNPYLPIRGADVEIIDNNTGNVLASTYTNNIGQFSAEINLTTSTDIFARVITTSSQNSRLFDHSVTRTPSTGGTPYVLTSQVFTNVAPGSNVDFTSSPVKANSTDIAGAFNIFDMSEYSESYMENLTSQVATMDLTLYWTEGATGSCKFYDLNGNVYLCGSTDDDDSYDDVLILHEIGHYIHLVYSANPSLYGAHSLTGTYDLRLGFTEGVGTYFAGAIRQYMGIEKPLIYIETDGTNLRFWGFSKAHNTDEIAGYSNVTFTALDAGNEATVGHAIFDLIDNTNTLDGTVGVDDDSISLPNLQGDQMVWNVLIAIKDNETSTAVVNGTRITMETFYDYWIILYPNYTAAFKQILFDHNIEYQRDSLESDDTHSDATWIGTDGSTYHHSYYPADDEDWSKFNATAGVEYLIKTRNLANGADTMLRVYDTDGTTLLYTNDDENCSVL